MSKKGNCSDNAVAESFFKTQEAKLAVIEHIEIWNNKKRLHSLGNLKILNNLN